MTGPAEEYADLLARAAPFLRPDRPDNAGVAFGWAAVAGDEWLRGRAELYLRGLPELPLDDDEMVDALLLALEELDAEAAAVDGGELRAWDPGKHPRGPGGKFRSTVDVLKEAVQKHRRGRGKGDPFDGYDREQLRRAARARGIELKRGEHRDSIAAKLLADLGGGKSKARAPKVSAPPASPPPRVTRNPAALTGDGQRWWKMLPDDTGYDEPVPVRNLVVVAGYRIGSGKAYRVDGVTVLVEDGAGIVQKDLIARDFIDHHKQLPADADTYQHGYAWLAGKNPDDAYWSTKYGMPGFTSLATAGDGGVRVWNRENSSLTPGSYEAELRHEFGHNVSSAAAARNLDDHSAAWADAGLDDLSATRPTDLTWTGRTIMKAQNIRFDYQSGKGYPRGVTDYGKSSPGEDYAESMAFYLSGPIGTGRFTPGGPLQPVYFRDLFPNRAAVFDQLFPGLAQQQKAAVSAR